MGYSTLFDLESYGGGRFREFLDLRLVSHDFSDRVIGNQEIAVECAVAHAILFCHLDESQF